MAITWAGLAPHPPIIVESVGRERCREASKTISGLKGLMRDLTEQTIERLIIISPHTPRPNQGLAAWMGSTVQGDFGRFGAPSARSQAPVDQVWMRCFANLYLNVYPLDREPLDHGALVPLYFAQQAGWQGKVCVLGLPDGDQVDLEMFASSLAAACCDPAPTAIIASGDMSHCLLPEGPYGYEPAGPAFDHAFVDHIKHGRYQDAAQIDTTLCFEAKQDVLESCWVIWNATNFRRDHHHFYSYEGPFGVGYTVMKFFGENVA